MQGNRQFRLKSQPMEKRKMKNLKQHLLEINRSGSCWMQDFEPYIQQAVKEWVIQNPSIYCKARPNCTLKGERCFTCKHGNMVTVLLKTLSPDFTS